MSLRDALFQDAVPMDVYIVADRPDGASGSGTEQDPYLAATQTTATYSITSISIDASYIPGTLLKTVTIQTSSTAPFQVGDLVLIDGTNLFFLNSTFPVTSVNTGTKTFTCAVWIAPADGGTPSGGTCRLDPYRFDAVMRKLQAAGRPVCVHLGPGVYETKGYGLPADQVSWRPITAMKIRGAGMALSTLRLVRAYYDGRDFAVIGMLNMGGSDGAVYSSADYFEASDLTLDANSLNQPSRTVTCGGAFVRGSHTRLRRVRAINFARGSPSQECFVLGLAGATYEATSSGSDQAVDCVVEDCVIESPGTFGVKETTCVNFMGLALSGGPEAGLILFHRSCVVRNCYIDCDHQQNPVEVASIATSFINDVDPLKKGWYATITTRMPHGLGVGDWSRVSGVQVSQTPVVNQFSNVYNGSCKVAASPAPAPTTMSFSYRLASQPADPGQVPATPLAGARMWVGRWSSHYIGIASVNVTLAAGIYTLKVVTQTPHFLVPVEKVSSAYARPSSVILSRLSTKSGAFDSPVDDLPLVLSAWDDNFTFEVQTTTDPSPGDTPPYALTATYGLLGVRFQGVGAEAGVDVVIEGCTVLNCRSSGPYHDSYSDGSLVARNNLFSGIGHGPWQTLGNPGLSDPSSISATYAIDGDFVTVTVARVGSTPHGLSIGQGILMTGFLHGGVLAPNGKYNGAYVIKSIPSSTSFTYVMANPGFTPDGTGAPRFQAMLESRFVVLESNTIELIPGADRLPTVGIQFTGSLPAAADFTSQPPLTYFRFRRVVVRNNQIRYVADVPTALPGRLDDVGLDIAYCEDALVSDNLIDLFYSSGSSQVPIPKPMTDATSKSVYYFNNRVPSGALAQGFSTPPGSVGGPVQEITTLVDDALMLSLL
jgi:hypothetical protein